MPEQQPIRADFSQVLRLVPLQSRLQFRTDPSRNAPSKILPPALPSTRPLQAPYFQCYAATQLQIFLVAASCR
jgi:hypothetical protein